MKPKFWLLAVLALASFLRFFQLTRIPPSLYWDEVSLGYNAFSILTQGTDEHGVSWPLTHFLAFGDAKPPLYIYATAVSMAIFGVGDWAVRFPSALAGILAVLITYYLTRELFPRHKSSSALGLTAALLLAISPWHLQMSRTAYEANLALTLFLFGLWAFFKGLTTPKYWVITTVTFIATLYTFNAYRIFLPFFLPCLALIYWPRLKSSSRHLVLNIILALILVAPLLPFVFSPQARLRFDEVNIFKNHQPVIQANLRIELNNHAWWANILHNRRVLFTLDFLRHYTDQLKPDFLFFSGDPNPRLGVRDLGLMYYIELPLLLAGIFFFIAKPHPHRLFFLLWLLTALIPAGIARETPHALRSLQILPLPQIIVSVGILGLVSKSKKLIPLLLVFYFIFFAHYLDLYYRHYSQTWSASWQYGYKPMVVYLKQNHHHYDRIYISDSLGRAYINTLYYLRFDPAVYLATRDAGGDAFGFTYTHSFDKYYFTPPPLSDKPDTESWLLVTPADGIVSGSHILHTVYDLKHQPVFVIQQI